MALLERVTSARRERDEAREELVDSQEHFVASIIAAAAGGCSLREIADHAGVSFQRVSKIIQREGGSAFPPDL